jgi:uncharacterized protein
MSADVPTPPIAAYDCQACGACCDYSPLWPRFSLESENEIARIPLDLISRDEGGMRCTGNRCMALDGVVTKHVTCTIYEIRPQICRACMPGDDACLMARERHGLPI